MDDDDLLQQALAMSMQESTPAPPAAPAAPVPVEANDEVFIFSQS
jgi:hypothetical protein